MSNHKPTPPSSRRRPGSRGFDDKLDPGLRRDDGNQQLESLADSVAQLTPAPQHPALRHLVESLKSRYEGCVVSILFYGSCLRSGDPFDGLVDLYLIVDNYRCANSSRAGAFWNWLLPPNVFYAEFPYEGKTIRCKYAVLTPDDFNKGTSSRWFHSYLWGRFSQPTAIAWSRDSEAQDAVATCMAQAVVTFLRRALPSIPATGTVQSLWQDALKLSYGTDLRPESQARAQQLTAYNADYYSTVTELAAPLINASGRRRPVSRTPKTLDTGMRRHDDKENNPGFRSFTFSPESGYVFTMEKHHRTLNRLSWRLRSLQGKFLSLARLSKALFTFEGGLDYIAWKLERHSGEHIEIPDKVRRYPLLFVWGMVWRLYRRGVFR